MRTRRLFELTLMVVLAHVIGWHALGGEAPVFAAARAGVHALQIVRVPPRAGVSPESSAGAEASAAPSSRTVAVAPARARQAQGRPRARAVHAPAARLLAGAGGTPQRANVPAPPWPVYATRAPPSATLHYALVQHTGAAASAAVPGEATLDWQTDGTAFTLRLVAAPADRPPREWASTGRFDAAGVAPERLVERERGRDKRAVNFDREGARVRFSGASGTLPIAPGAQDRWSWLAQLAAIAEAGARRGQLAGPWELQVAGLRGELEHWTFRVLPSSDPPPELLSPGNELSTPGVRAPALLHVLRATERPYDLRIEAWLSPSLHHFPAGLRLSTPPGPWSLVLWQRST